MGKTDRLYVDSLLLKPRDYDWSEGFAEKWDVIQPFEMDAFSDEDEGNNEEKTGYACFEDMEMSNTPMMNYYYPLPIKSYGHADFDSDDAKKINDLPLCLVYFTDNESYALALTGGGMDLSWQICEAYMRLGFYPPVHFRLPMMAGKTLTARNKRIISACKKGRKIVKQWMDSDLRDLKRVQEYMKEETEKRKNLG